MKTSSIEVQDGAVIIVFNPDETCEFIRVGESACNFDTPSAKWGGIIAAYIREKECVAAIVKWFKADYAKVMSKVDARKDLH